MSSTTTTAAASTPTACTNLYDTPVRDAACAMPYSSEHIDMMNACCGDADVMSYYDDCGLYCVADGQSIGDLTDCLYDEGARYEHVFCRGEETATATGDGAPRETADATPVDGDDGDDNEGGDDDNNDDGDDEDSSAPQDEDDAAPGVVPPAHVSLVGVAIGTLLFSATAFGTLQF